MDKKILYDYIDACELIKETEQDIQRLKKKRGVIVQSGVKGSNPEFPYQEQHFRMEGVAYSYGDDVQLRMEEKLLLERKARAQEIKTQVEAWMNRNATGEGLRKEFERFMCEK